MPHVERDSGHGAENRDTVLRTVVFAFVSLAAWWCCSNVASADDAPAATPPASPPAPADSSLAATAPVTDSPGHTGTAPASPVILAAGPSPSGPTLAPPSAPAGASGAATGAPTVAFLGTPAGADQSGGAQTGGGEGLGTVVEMLGIAGGAPRAATQELRAADMLGTPGVPDAARLRAPWSTDGPATPGGALDATEMQGPRLAAGAAEPGVEGPVVVSDPAEAFEVEPGVMAGVVLPLVAAVEPALAPLGEVVDPVIEAVATPLAPLVQTVVPVVDQVAGPVLGPVVTPLVAAVAPVVEQASRAVAPVVELVAPVVVPVAKPVVGLVAPVVGQVAATVVAPLVAVVHPAVRSVLDLESRVLGLRPATTAFAREAAARADGSAPAAWLPAGDDPTTIELAPGRGTLRSTNRAGTGASGWEDAAVQPGAPAPAAAPGTPGAPFRPAVPAQPAVVMAHGGADTSQRTQRLVAVLSPAGGAPAAPISALSRAPAVSPLARFGGRPPVTPD